MHDQGTRFDRRAILRGGGVTVAALAGAAAVTQHKLRPSFAQGTPGGPDVPAELVIDVSGGPDTLDPALARSSRDWSIIHSIYDSVIQVGADGEIVPLAAERFEAIDDMTWEVGLRPGLSFHDGRPISAEAIARPIQHVQASEGPAARDFSVISAVEVLDELTARIVTSGPAPWLPYQIAVWAVLFPEGMTPDAFESSPIGSGPFAFVSRERGTDVVLSRNPAYTWASPKGTPLAGEVRFREVPDAATRVADLASGTANLSVSVDVEQREAIESGGGQVLEAPIVGALFLRIATDASPFDDPRVSRAINLATDVQTIAASLVGPQARRLASIFPDERSIGFDPALEPFAFDPAAARALLDEASLGDGFEVRLEFVAGERDDVLQAIAANLAEVGIDVSLQSMDLATFNGSWTEPGSAPLRLVSWRPIYDPHTLLNLMFASTGPLSRHRDARADTLIASASGTVDPARRAERYRELGRLFQEAPPAVFLWNLTSIYGVREFGVGWSPRGDDYVIPTSTEKTG